MAQTIFQKLKEGLSVHVQLFFFFSIILLKNFYHYECSKNNEDDSNNHYAQNVRILSATLMHTKNEDHHKYCFAAMWYEKVIRGWMTNEWLDVKVQKTG